MPEQDPRIQATQTPEQAPGALRNMFDAARSFPQVVALEHHLTNRSQHAERATAIVAGALILAAAAAVVATSEREALAQEPSTQPNTDPEFVADYCMDDGNVFPRVTLLRGARKIKQAGATLRPWISDGSIEGPLISPELGRMPCPGGKTLKIWRFMENDEARIKRVGPMVTVTENSTERIRGYYDVPVYDGVKHTCWDPDANKNSNSTRSRKKKESAAGSSNAVERVRYRRSGFKTRKTLNIGGETKTLNNTFNDVEITPAFGRGVVKIC